MDKLQVEIEKGRLEMVRLQQEIKADSRKFIAQAGITAAALISAGVAAGAYLGPRRAAVQPAPQVIIIQAPPDTTATVVPPAHK